MASSKVLSKMTSHYRRKHGFPAAIPEDPNRIAIPSEENPERSNMSLSYHEYCYLDDAYGIDSSFTDGAYLTTDDDRENLDSLFWERSYSMRAIHELPDQGLFQRALAISPIDLLRR